jgi:hypothetical protein
MAGYDKLTAAFTGGLSEFQVYLSLPKDFKMSVGFIEEKNGSWVESKIGQKQKRLL